MARQRRAPFGGGRFSGQLRGAAGRNAATRIAAHSAAIWRRDQDTARAMAQEAARLGPDPVGNLARWRDALGKGD
jgi:hypothetical protein